MKTISLKQLTLLLNNGPCVGAKLPPGPVVHAYGEFGGGSKLVGAGPPAWHPVLVFDFDETQPARERRFLALGIGANLPFEMLRADMPDVIGWTRVAGLTDPDQGKPIVIYELELEQVSDADRPQAVAGEIVAP